MTADAFSTSACSALPCASMVTMAGKSCTRIVNVPPGENGRDAPTKGPEMTPRAKVWRYGVFAATACWPWLRVTDGGLATMLRWSVHRLQVLPSEPMATPL